MKRSHWNYFNEPEDLPDKVDCLCGINQETSIDDIIKVIADTNTAAVVSTHAPLPNELVAVESRMPYGKIYWRTMSSLLLDSDMQACDEEAVQRHGDERSAGAIMEASRVLRNQKALAQLGIMTEWDECYVDDGLGLCAEAWPSAKRFPSKHSGKTSLRDRVKQRLESTRAQCEHEVIETRSALYVFLGPTARLRIRPGFEVRTETVPVPVAWASGTGGTNELRLLSGSVETLAKRAGKPVQVCTTVHAYDPDYLALWPDLRVFVDGLHTPNYPVSYGASFRGAKIVWREQCDREWFTQCGCEVEAPPNFVQTERPVEAAGAVRPIEHVCLMLNHAGDWSALIDRSDTDLTVLEFVKAAQASQLRFRIRPHPTMTLPEHEGTASLERLRNWVNSLGMANLEFSNNTLEEDIEWTDCCVSEYSNVLIDCLKLSKAGVALNPTGRRNFLSYLTPIGLETAKDAGELNEIIRSLKE